MLPRQLWLFKFGCWATLATALLYLARHLAGPAAPANETERQLLELASSYRFVLPGGSERSLMNLFDGFSLMFVLLLATLGALGLSVARRAQHDATLMAAVARVLAVSSAVLLVISLTNFYVIPTMCLAAMALCYAMAAVRAPGVE